MWRAPKARWSRRSSRERHAVINADDAYAPLWRELTTRAASFTFGLGATADFRAPNLRLPSMRDGFSTRFDLQCALGTCPWRSPSPAGTTSQRARPQPPRRSPPARPRRRSSRASRRCALVGGRCSPAAAPVALADRRYLQRQSGFGARGARMLAELPGRAGWCWATWRSSAATPRDSHRRSARSHASVDRAAAAPRPAARARGRSFGRGAESHPDIDALIARSRRELPAERALLIKGSRVNRLERVVSVAHRRAACDAARRADAVLAANTCAVHYSVFNVFRYLTLRAILAALTALAISLLVGPLHDRAPGALPDRSGRARRRPAVAPAQGGHADHGRHADPLRDGA